MAMLTPINITYDHDLAHSTVLEQIKDEGVNEISDNFEFPVNFVIENEPMRKSALSQKEESELS